MMAIKTTRRVGWYCPVCRCLIKKPKDKTCECYSEIEVQLFGELDGSKIEKRWSKVNNKLKAKRWVPIYAFIMDIIRKEKK